MWYLCDGNRALQWPTSPANAAVNVTLFQNLANILCASNNGTVNYTFARVWIQPVLNVSTTNLTYVQGTNATVTLSVAGLAASAAQDDTFVADNGRN